MLRRLTVTPDLSDTWPAASGAGRMPHLFGKAADTRTNLPDVVWHGWSDFTTPRTDRPVRFQFHQWREDVGRAVVRRSASRIVAA